MDGSFKRDDTNFDHSGKFTPIGWTSFWYGINALIKDFEHHESNHKLREGVSKALQLPIQPQQAQLSHQ